MHLLPLNLGHLADHTGDSARVSVGGVHLELSEGRYTATATDCKQIISVSGPVAGDAAEYPEWPALRDAPNGATTANIPARMWKAFFATAKKKTPKRTTRKELQSVAVKLSHNEATLACTDLDAGVAECTKQVEGRFPPTDQIWPTKKPTMVFTFNPAYVAQMAKSLATFADDPTDARMVVEITDACRPIVFKVEREDGTVARGLLMPFGETGGGKKAKAETIEANTGGGEEETKRVYAALARSQQELEAVKDSQLKLGSQVERLLELLKQEEADATALLLERDALQAELDAVAKKPAKKGRTKKGAVPVGPPAPAELSSAEKAEQFTCGDFLNNVFAFLKAAVVHYEKSAPTVSDHADETYRRFLDPADFAGGHDVTWREIGQLLQLRDEVSREWEQPNAAANRVYKLRHSMGMDVTGHAGF